MKQVWNDAHVVGERRHPDRENDQGDPGGEKAPQDRDSRDRQGRQDAQSEDHQEHDERWLGRQKLRVCRDVRSEHLRDVRVHLDSRHRRAGARACARAGGREHAVVVAGEVVGADQDQVSLDLVGRDLAAV